MKATKLLSLLLFTVAGLVMLAAKVLSDEAPLAEQRAKLVETYNAGNYKDAYDGLRKLALDPNNAPDKVGEDLNLATQALANLGRTEEMDEFREAVIAVHAKNWRLLWSAAENCMQHDHHGYIVAGKFLRGGHRGGGRLVNSFERDRVRALQLMTQAIPLTKDAPERHLVASFYLGFGNQLMANRGYYEAWRLQYLTDLGVLPDYEDGWYQQGSNASTGAPVDAEGNPIFHKVPKSWETAATDGERWRWFLTMAAEFAPDRLNEVRMNLGAFLHAQFGEQTMVQYGYFWGEPDQDDDTKKDESGTYALHTLGEDETIARLANGIKRFKLPDEFNFIRIFQTIADEPKTGLGEQALQTLATIFENRRQYPKAADYWRRSIKEYGDPVSTKQQRIDQIVGNWGRFEPIMTQPAGKGATVEFRFRNGKRVEFEAQAIKVDKLLNDVKAYLKTRPERLDWQKLNIGDLGYRLVQEHQTEYVGDKVASWGLDLEPREQHFDKRITVETPLEKAGAYLLTAKVAGGNTSQIIMWVADTAIVKKVLQDKTFYYVGDAVNGAPVAKANVEFFGYKQTHIADNRYKVDIQQFAEFTDADGQLLLDSKTDFQWIVTATTKEGRLAYLGFTHMWSGQYYDYEYNERKVFTITDRPVYRPGQPVKFKFWVRHAKYDQEDTSDFAGQAFTVEIHDPKGDKILTKGYTADAYGGIEGEFTLANDATLGMYGLYIAGYGGGNFRVEEYKKPEFEVTIDAPTEPVMLGEKITATIKAKYYFGSPVANAQVKYKVLRTSQTTSWYPWASWDWLYGSGYWWYAYDYAWYPGWRDWGCRRPSPWWFPVSYQPPEVVAEQTVPILPDGTVPVEIDTAVAKAMHGDSDHSYSITAEVVNQSRRTIVGQGNVLVARKPFKVFAWVDRGYYRVGDVIEASFSARTLDQKPVQGQGKLSVVKISYDKDSQPVETPIYETDLDTNDQGLASKKMKAAGPGQFRLSYKVTDSKEHTIEGGYLFTIVGAGFDGGKFHFNDLELVPQKREFAPGETVNLQVNTDQADSTVLLFVRPANGVYLPPKIMRLKGKSAVDEIAVVKKDMPNFFIEAVTITKGKLITEVKEIVVPPEKRVLNVEVTPSSETYRPGEKATVKIRLTDFFGKPFVGSTVLAVYDKALEYISGGSNVPQIKEFFWKWRRSHYTQSETSLARHSQNLAEGNNWMHDLGVFGGTVTEEAEGMAIGGMGGRGGARYRALAKSARSGLAEESNEMFARDAAPAAPAAALEAEFAAGGEGGVPGGAAAPPAMVEPTIRTKFADAAFWAGALTTDENGAAEITFDMPENLTAWKIKAWSMGHGTKVGQGEKEVVTRKDLIVRMQAPRFFVQKDEVTLSANVHNYLKTAKSVEVILELASAELVALDEVKRRVEVPAGGETRVDWRVKVTQEGKAVVRMKALTDEESDAMEMTFPVFVHGMLKMESFAGALRPKDEAGKVVYRVPAERRIEQSRLEVRYSPTLAAAMVDALPYLAEYPYGCTEQTLNRFVPTVITQKILLDMGLDLKAIQEKRTNLNAQEIGDDRERAKGWQRFERNPVFDITEVQNMTKAGVQKLTEMQLSDGGWGWFSGYGEYSYPHTTATVVHGLQIAQQNDVALAPGILERGVAWLKAYQDQQVQYLKNALVKPEPVQPYKNAADNLDALVYMTLVDAGEKNQDMLDFLYRDRTGLTVYSKAMFGLALHKQDEKEKLSMILKNIEQFLVQDDENQTAYLKLPNESYWWYWYGNEIEANAYYLKLLSRTDPQGDVASRLVKYVLNNRKHATYWNSTRNTALAIEALAEYLKASGEDKPDLTVEVWLDGQKRKEVHITAQDLFTFDNKFVLTGDGVEDGEHTLELRKRGTGPLYYNAYVTNLTLEDFITAAGLEVRVNRKYYKLVPVDKTVKVEGARGQALDQKVEKYERQLLENGATLKSGDLVEIEMEIDSKNDYEYLVFEDKKAAGFEPVEVRSGYNGNDMGAYMELRDDRVSFFVRALARGKHSVSYRMRAEIPGKFSALPSHGYAMYAPELQGNSDEIKVNIVD